MKPGWLESWQAADGTVVILWHSRRRNARARLFYGWEIMFGRGKG